MQTTSSNSTTLSGGTMVSVKQEGTVQDSLVPSYVDSTTFLNSPTVQQPATAIARQQSSAQSSQQHRTGSSGSSDDCEPVSLPSKLWLVVLFCGGRAVPLTPSLSHRFLSFVLLSLFNYAALASGEGIGRKPFGRTFCPGFVPWCMSKMVMELEGTRVKSLAETFHQASNVCVGTCSGSCRSFKSTAGS